MSSIAFSGPDLLSAFPKTPNASACSSRVQYVPPPAVLDRCTQMKVCPEQRVNGSSVAHCSKEIVSTSLMGFLQHRVVVIAQDDLLRL